MPQTRTEALTAILDDLAGIEVGLNDYYDDPEPQGVFDNVLTGKIDSLRAYCQILGWSELVATMQGMTPLRGNAIESLETIKNFVIPEARRLLAAGDVEGPSSPTQWFWELMHPRIRTLARPRFNEPHSPFVDVWLRNDFGIWAFNLRRNGRGTPYYIHTTPKDETSSPNVRLAPSHGCIHIRPSDRGTMIHGTTWRQASNSM